MPCWLSVWNFDSFPRGFPINALFFVFCALLFSTAINTEHGLISEYASELLASFLTVTLPSSHSLFTALDNPAKQQSLQPPSNPAALSTTSTTVNAWLDYLVNSGTRERKASSGNNNAETQYSSNMTAVSLPPAYPMLAALLAKVNPNQFELPELLHILPTVVAPINTMRR